MRPIHLLYLLVLFISIHSVACKQEQANVQQEPETAAQPQAESATPAQPQDNNQTSADPAAQGHDYTFLTDKILIYEAAFGGKTGADQPYKDEWIDLSSDGTFKAGKHQNQTHTGKWSYNHDTQTLFLRPDVREYKMSEWKVMHNDQMMVWVGTQTYGDNNVQLKLGRSAQLPQ